MANLIDKLRKLFQSTAVPTAVPARETSVSSLQDSPLTFDDAAITRLMRQVEETEEGQYTCAETFALLDEYAELVVSNKDAAVLMPLVEAHLRVCPECSPRYEVLRTILQTEE